MFYKQHNNKTPKNSVSVKNGLVKIDGCGYEQDAFFPKKEHKLAFNKKRHNAAQCFF